MAFDFSAGLSSMGEAVAKTAGAYTLEAQKAEAQKEMLVLADQMASTRESKGRAESHGYALETLDKQQTFTGKENQLNRDSADRHNAASVGASVSNAQLAASTQKEIAALGVKARSEEHDKTIAATLQTAAKPHIDNEGNVFSVNVATGKVEPLKAPDGTPLTGRDPEVAKAMTAVVTAKVAQLKDLTTTYVPQLQQLETTLRKLQSDPLTAADKNAQKELADTQARIKALQDRFNAEKAPLTRELDEYGRWLKSKSKAPGGTASGDIDWTKYLKTPEPLGMPDGLVNSARQRPY